jgi:hypothetical protein
MVLGRKGLEDPAEGENEENSGRRAESASSRSSLRLGGAAASAQPAIAGPPLALNIGL